MACPAPSFAFYAAEQEWFANLECFRKHGLSEAKGVIDRASEPT